MERHSMRKKYSKGSCPRIPINLAYINGYWKAFYPNSSKVRTH